MSGARWISFINTTEENIPAYGVISIKPYLGDFSDIDAEDADPSRDDLIIIPRAEKPVVLIQSEVEANPMSAYYSWNFALNSSAVVPPGGTGRCTFATDGPAWMYVGYNTTGDNDPLGTPMGPNRNTWEGRHGSIGFRTVSLVDIERRRVLVMADPGPYPMQVLSVGAFGGSAVNVDDTAWTTATAAPYPIAACGTPDDYSEGFPFVVPVDFTKLSGLVLHSGVGGSAVPPRCRDSSLIMVARTGVCKSISGTPDYHGNNQRFIAITGDITFFPKVTVTADGVDLSGTVSGDASLCVPYITFDGTTFESGSVVSGIWTGCELYVLDSGCPTFTEES